VFKNYKYKINDSVQQYKVKDVPDYNNADMDTIIILEEEEDKVVFLDEKLVVIDQKLIHVTHERK
jgi:hypothetical protein